MYDVKLILLKRKKRKRQQQKKMVNTNSIKLNKWHQTARAKISNDDNSLAIN